MQLKEMVLAILNESELLLSDDGVEQIVDQVQCFNRNHFLSQIPPEFLQTIQIPPEPYHPNGAVVEEIARAMMKVLLTITS